MPPRTAFRAASPTWPKEEGQRAAPAPVPAPGSFPPHEFPLADETGLSRAQRAASSLSARHRGPYGSPRGRTETGWDFYKPSPPARTALSPERDGRGLRASQGRAAELRFRPGAARSRHSAARAGRERGGAAGEGVGRAPGPRTPPVLGESGENASSEPPSLTLPPEESREGACRPPWAVPPE